MDGFTAMTTTSMHVPWMAEITQTTYSMQWAAQVNFMNAYTGLETQSHE
jgi:hypothetical protein